MDLKRIARAVDHTLLSPTATWPQIRELCDEALACHAASVCIPPGSVARACGHLGGALPVGTVIGFPNGYSMSEVKAFEARLAVESGAGEVDMVINLGWVREGLYDSVLEEIRAVRRVTDGRILKVIIETSELDNAQIIRMCGIVSLSGADYIKTSTGFASGGATREAVALMAEHLNGRVKIKASGGISTLKDAEDFLNLGAERLGTSRVLKLIREAGGIKE